MRVAPFAAALLLAVLSQSATAAPRAPWRGSRVVGSPEPPPPYTTRRAFPALPLESVLDARPEPGTGRLWVVDGRGRIRALQNRSGRSATTVLELGREIYAIAFHPRYAENRQVFAYTGDRRQHPPHFRIARFLVGKDGRIDPGTELPILEQSIPDHFGGSIHFGPDGYLYFGFGDGGGIGDPRETGQDVSDLLASIHRIDVDRPSGRRPYGIPADNPFVSTPGARPEVFAFGIRNPWRFAFDRVTGALWVGDVGQDLWESILLVEKGGNYGWSLREGSHPYHPQRKRGPAEVKGPVVEQPHSEFRSITGGLVYRGRRFPKLVGTYIYGDYDTGQIWGVRREGERVTWHGQLADTALRVVAFGEDAHGEPLVLSYPGEIHTLEPQAGRPGRAFPRKLSETGLFASTREHSPAAGVVSYDVSAPLWSDGAHKQRFIALPGQERIVVNERPRWDQPRWKFPEGTVFVKTFALGIKRLETRLWTLQEGQWRGYTYVWNDDDSDADLLGAEGLDRSYTTDKGRQTWHFPSRSECSLCHTMAAGFVLGFSPEQLGARLADLAPLFDKPPAPPKVALVDPQDAAAPLEARARSYLHGNCGHCHRPWGGGYARFRLTADVATADAGLIDARAERGSFGLDDPRVVVPGHPETSVLYLRMATLDAGRMPSVASSVVDPLGLELVRRFIASLPPPSPPRPKETRTP